MGTLSLWPPAVSKGADRAVVRDLGARAVTTRDVGAAFGRAVAHMARGSRGKGGGVGEDSGGGPPRRFRVDSGGAWDVCGVDTFVLATQIRS